MSTASGDADSGMRPKVRRAGRQGYNRRCQQTRAMSGMLRWLRARNKTRGHVHSRFAVPRATMRLRLVRILALVALATAANAARAQLTIEITGGGENQIPIAIVPFAGESALPQSLSAIVEADLVRSARFRTLFVGSQPAPVSEATKIDFSVWRDRAADAVLVGGVYPKPGGRFEARFMLYDVPNAASLGGLTITITPALSRAAAHRIADYVYERLTGDRGVFSTRIAYIVKGGGRYELQIADADGFNAQVALSSKEPIISPTWSPDGTRIAYVSFELQKPVVYVQSLISGKRHAVANYPGSNSAPAWSPDGRQLAVSLARDGGMQLHLINADGSNLRRLTASDFGVIDTEPCFTPDGKFIYFTSDRGGTPQIYRLALAGGEPQRITFDGEYNVTPRISPDGKTLAFVALVDGHYQLAAMDLASQQTMMLSDGFRDESPSFAPNGKMILYAAEVNGRGVLAATSSDGRIKQRLSVAAADVREPAWGPFLTR